MRDLPRRPIVWLCTLLLGVLVAAWPDTAIASNGARGSVGVPAATALAGTDCVHDTWVRRAVPQATRGHRHLNATPSPPAGRRSWQRAARRIRLTGDESLALPVLGSIQPSHSLNANGGEYGRTAVLPPVHRTGRLAAPPRAPPI